MGSADLDGRAPPELRTQEYARNKIDASTSTGLEQFYYTGMRWGTAANACHGDTARGEIAGGAEV